MGTRTEILGRVSISRGRYSEHETYYMQNIVLYANGSYMVSVPEITGIPPIDNDGNLNQGWLVYNAVPVVQQPGNGQESVMSQKAVTDTYGSLEENPEYIEVTLDHNGKVIEGVKVDGQKYLAKPSNQDEELKKQIDSQSQRIDDVHGIIGNKSYVVPGTAERVEATGIYGDMDNLSSRIGGVEEKTSPLSFTDNPEYLEVTTDAEGKFLEGMRVDGQKCLAKPTNQDERLQEQIDDISNTLIQEKVDEAKAQIEQRFDEIPFDRIESPEFVDVTLDANNKIIEGTKVDGQKYLAKPTNQDQKLQEQIDAEITALNNALEEVADKVEDLPFESVDNPQYMDVTVDKDNKVLECITTDGVKEVNIIHSYNKPVSFNDDVSLGQKGEQYISDFIKDNGLDIHFIRPHLPKFGTTNIKQETFYLEYSAGLSAINDVTLRQDFEDSLDNARHRITIFHYYHNNRRLRFYASGKVKKVDGAYYAQDTIRKIQVTEGNVTIYKYYWADTLGMASYSSIGGYSNRTRVVEGYSVEIPTALYNAHQSELDALPNKGALFIPAESKEISVVQMVGTPCIRAWTIEDWDTANIAGTDIGKKFGHDCLVDVDFGSYLTLTDYKTEVKLQGNSTMGRRKHNLRYKFNKKQKIGEMIRTKSYNLKAAFSDNTRFNENFMFRMLLAVWNQRPLLDRFPWDGGVNGYYHGATGFIKCFPVTVSVGGEFYGLYIFGNKKDAKNYLLDDEDDASGILVSGASVSSNDWGGTLPYTIKSHYDEELDASGTGETSQETQNALTTWTHFINNRLYIGSDNKEYNSAQLTEVGGQMCLTSTLDRKFVDEDNNEYLRSQLTHIGSVYYVTSSLVDGSPTDESIVATFSHYEIKEGSISAELIPFDRANMDERLDVLGFIDYLICMQVFIAFDNSHNNMIIYSGPDKKKMYPFFYDVDNTIPYTDSTRRFDCSIFDEGVALSTDMSLWTNIKNLCWDEIINRYYQLRDTVLNMDFIKNTYKDLADNIPDEAYTNENSKWGATTSKANFDGRLTWLEKRLDWLDNNFFVK